MIDGLGRIRPGAVLGTIQLNGATKLIVNPWAAIGTDLLLISMSGATFLLTKNPILRTLSILGGLWGITATVLEVTKVARPESDPISREF